MGLCPRPLSVDDGLVAMPLIYVLPVHNEEAVLGGNVARLRSALERHPGASMLLVENGSRDGSAALARRLAEEPHAVRARAFSLPEAGIGHAYDRGLREALRLVGASTAHWAVLTAADLPFGFTDLEQAIPHLDDQAGPLLIGSKAHPRSQVHAPRRRVLATTIYRGLRRTLAGMRAGDSQGSVFLRLDVAARLVDLVTARDFFYSTELVFHAERLRHPIIELPVVVAPESRASTVRPLRHGAAMLVDLVRTVGRFGRIGAAGDQRVAARNRHGFW
jgi:dolichyl-phosphate beta-glucosyltransferase